MRAGQLPKIHNTSMDYINNSRTGLITSFGGDRNSKTGVITKQAEVLDENRIVLYKRGK